MKPIHDLFGNKFSGSNPLKLACNYHGLDYSYLMDSARYWGGDLQVVLQRALRCQRLRPARGENIELTGVETNKL